VSPLGEWRSDLLLARVSFSRGGWKETEELVGSAETYLSCLRWDGHISGDWLLGWRRGRLEAYVYLAEPKAPSARGLSAFGKESLATLSALGSRPRWTVLEEGLPPPRPSWRKEPFLFLSPDPLDGRSPVRRGSDGTSVPLYKLPLGDRLSNRVFTWARAWSRWFEMFTWELGELETAAYRELADPRSRLGREGRALARQVEKAAGVEVYHHLKRHWGCEDEEERPCLGCGRGWLSPEGDETYTRFRCRRCRLVSGIGIDVTCPEMARIGERPPPARKARRKAR
jgi:hypothetical protein